MADLTIKLFEAVAFIASGITQKLFIFLGFFALRAAGLLKLENRASTLENMEKRPKQGAKSILPLM